MYASDRFYISFEMTYEYGWHPIFVEKIIRKIIYEKFFLHII